jgi:endo-1,4-beta-xylanase
MMNMYGLRYILMSVALVALTGCFDTQPPTVSITASSGFFNAPGTLTLTVDAVDARNKKKKVKIDEKNVKQVVFRQGDTVIGVDKKAPFTLNVPVTAARNGYHLYTATAYDKMGNNATSEPARVTIAIDNKFFGTAPGDAGDYEHLLDYFDQLTPENAGKWGSVEGTRDVMNWTDLDTAYNFARANGIPFKLHTLVWGQQEPGWVSGLSPEEQLEELEEWFGEVAARYPDLEMIEVVNEPLHAPPSYRNALGGAGTTGWDWVIKSFEMAREHFPNTQLILNDYQILHLPQFTADYLVVINLLKERGLIDAIGLQGHFLEQTQGSMVQTNLNTLAATGLPIYITEFDLDLANHARHANQMRELFTVFWEHPSVIGVTHWGHREGSIWRTNAYLLRADGSERPAMQWLVCYLAGGGDMCFVPEYVPPGWQGNEFGLTLEAELYDEGDGLVALGNVVAFTDDGDWIAFSGVEFRSDWNKLWVTYAKGNTDVGSISIHLDALENAPVITVPLEPTAGWGSFETLELPWSMVTGAHDVYIRFNDVFGVANVDNIRFGKPIPESEVNLMPNGGFEAGITGWSSWNGSSLSASTAQVFAGSQSLLATARPNAAQFAVSPDLSGVLTAGTTYTVKARVYHTGAAADTVRLASKVGCSSGDSFPWIHNHTAVPANTWTELSGTWTIPAACTMTDVRIFFEGTAPGSDVYVDEVKVVPPPGTSVNLMSNGSFESGITGWSSWNGSTLSASSLQAHAGSQSLSATARPNAAQFAVSPDLSGVLTAGTSYTVKAWVYHTGAVADTVRLASKVGCSSGDSFPWIHNHTAVPANTWTELSGTWTIPAACTMTDVRIFFEGTAPGSDVYVDEVMVLAP